MKIKRYLEVLIHIEQVANINYEIWWIYKNKEDRSKYIRIMNKYSEFFSASIHAHFVAMLMALAKLYEKGNTININEFLKLASHHQFIAEDTIVKAKESLKDNKGLIEKICILRSNYFAHVSKNLSYDDVLKKANIKYKNFKELIDIAYDLLNKMSCACNMGSYSLRCFSKGDTYRLLNDLTKKKLTCSNLTTIEK